MLSILNTEEQKTESKWLNCPFYLRACESIPESGACDLAFAFGSAP